MGKAISCDLFTARFARERRGRREFLFLQIQDHYFFLCDLSTSAVKYSQFFFDFVSLNNRLATFMNEHRLPAGMIAEGASAMICFMAVKGREISKEP